MKYLETVIGSGMLDEINKTDYITAFEQLNVTGTNLTKDSLIFCEKDVIDKVCIVNKGSVRSEKVYPDGDIHIMQIYEVGGVFALETALSKLKTSPLEYICNEDSTIVFVPIRAIESSDYRNEIMDTLVQRMASDSIKNMYKIEILAERGLRQRILLYLHILQKKSGTKKVSVKMDREQMAQYLCVNRSALSNELNKMKREKIIDFR